MADKPTVEMVSKLVVTMAAMGKRIIALEGQVARMEAAQAPEARRAAPKTRTRKTEGAA